MGVSREPKMWVGGAWTESKTGQTRAILNPTDQSVLAVVPEAEAADVEAAVAAARAAFDGGAWPQRSGRERGAILCKVAETIRAHADELAALDTRNMGKPLVEAEFDVADKLRGWSAKRILKAAVRDRVPSAILARPKRGFPVPYARWLRDDLREPLRELLTDRRSVQRGYFRRDAIAALLDHPAPSPDDAKTIFSLVVLELWHRLFVDGTPIVLR